MPVRDLIYDIGQHRGEDTAYYLAKGYRVVAVEANPELVAVCRERFENDISAGRLIIVEGAVANADGPVTFYVHDRLSVWGTTSSSWAHRNESLGESRPVKVNAVHIGDLLREYGIPHYLKIDVEGADRLCLDAIAGLDERPSYISIESTQESYKAVRDELDLLATLGYRRFAVVQQANLPATTIHTRRIDGSPLEWRIEPDASGGFGEDIQHWTDLDGALARYRRIFWSYRLLNNRLTRVDWAFRARVRLSSLARTPLPGWYDTHAQR